MTQESLLRGLQHIIQGAIDRRGVIRAKADRVAAEHPEWDRERVAQDIIDHYAIINGCCGAVASVGGPLTLPVAIPANLIACWRVQAEMVIGVAYAMGREHETDLMRDVVLVMAGDPALKALRMAGVQAAKHLSWKLIDKYVTREVMKSIWKVVGRKVITKAGEKSILSFARIVPLVGAAVGYGIDWSTTQGVGRTALAYYR